jgi:hypothetical protein
MNRAGQYVQHEPFGSRIYDPRLGNHSIENALGPAEKTLKIPAYLPKIGRRAAGGGQSL